MVLLVQRMDGLGNSIKNLLSSIRMANEKKIDYIVLDNRLYNIFNLKKPDGTYNVTHTQASANWYYNGDDYNNPFPKNILVKEDHYKTILNKYGDFTFDFKFNFTPKPFINNYRIIINNIQINPLIRFYIQQFYNNNFVNKKIAGFHIRTWLGNKWAICEKSRMRNKSYHCLDYFINEIQRAIDDNYTPFVTSDDDNTIRILRDRFPCILINDFSTNIILDDRVLEKTNLNKPQMDFIDILLLSLSERFIGSFLSTYSELVYYFSNTIKEVIIL